MITEAPPEILSPEDLAYMSTLNERDRRRFLAKTAADLKAQGFSHDTSRFVCDNWLSCATAED